MAKPTKADVSELMKAWGKKGGHARAEKLTKEELSDQGREAVQARWAKKKKKKT